MKRLYSELRSRAAAHLRAERQGHTLQPTALVNEAYLRLCAGEGDFSSRTQFLAVASRTFRRVLVDHARRRKARKRSGAPGLRVSVCDLDAGAVAGGDRHLGGPIDLLILDEALGGLDAVDERAGRIVELKFFGGMTHDQVASLLGVSRATVEEDWRFARAWLRRRLSPDGESGVAATAFG